MLQKVIDKPESSSAGPRESVISAPRFAVLHVPIKQIDGAPLVVHAFSAKRRGEMEATQEEGGQASKRKNKKPKNFEALYQDARHLTKEGWDGVPCNSFRKALISACTLVDFHMTTARKTLFVESDGLSLANGSPVVRIMGKPYQFRDRVRIGMGKTDIAVRPRWDQWTAVLRIRYDQERFTETDVLNLVRRAGMQCGVAEGRPTSNSGGVGWGLFEVDESKPIQLALVATPDIQHVSQEIAQSANGKRKRGKSK